MIKDHAHRGVREPGPFTQPSDRRILELDDALRVLEITSSLLPNTSFIRDSVRAAQSAKTSLNAPTHIFRGVILHALPFLNWYKVQAGDGSGVLMACKLEHSSLTPLGPRDTGVLPPNTSVLLFKSSVLNHAHIIGVIPPSLANGNLLNPDWLCQGGGSGLKRETAHKWPVNFGAGQSGCVIDWSANRPMDETTFMKGWISSTGLAILLDDFQAYMRVNEQCGLFLNFFDSYCRLAGMQLDIESAIHSEYCREDEGESRLFKGISAYPWEALGLYEPGQLFTETNDPTNVQYNLHVADTDLADQYLEPIYRTMNYGGYLGQGSLRTVMVPASQTGVNLYGNNFVDEGLFRESIGLDGTVSIISAKRVHIGKRCKIVIPKEIRLPEDGLGDDSKANNYKFSGLFGTGPAHKIQDPTVPGSVKHMRLVAGVQDMIAYIVNWQALHPFQYHQGDYFTPQESQQNFDRIIDTLDYDVLNDSNFMADPTPHPLHIDHRYGNVNYFERESFLTFHDDGSVQLGCGYGAQAVFSGGGITLEAPAFIRLLAGTDLITFADQTCLRSKHSTDISSALSDIRIKAERNMQVIAGNSGTVGGMLFETKAPGIEQVYDGNFGEDVVSHGIVFKAKQSICGLFAQDIYLRTGGGELGAGDIIIDAAKGHRKCYIYASEFNTFTTQAVQFNYGPIDADSAITKSYYFGSNTCIIDGQLLLNGKLISYGEFGGAILNGCLYATGSIGTAGVVADHDGGPLSQVPDNFLSTLDAVFIDVAVPAENAMLNGANRHNCTIVERYYQSGQIGNDNTINDIGFSFRDPPGDPVQYKTVNLQFLEPRWQTLSRFGMATGGGFGWHEPYVCYQGQKTYPWPGNKKWNIDSIFMELGSFSLFNPTTGFDTDRPGNYETAHLNDLNGIIMATGFKVNRP